MKPFSNELPHFSCVINSNPEQNNIAGLLENFSKLEHSCRKCMISRKEDMLSPRSYDEIHAREFPCRTNESIKEDFAEKELLRVTHVNGC